MAATTAVIECGGYVRGSVIRLAVAMGGTVALLAAPLWIPHEATTTFAVIGSIFLGVPLSILLYRDAVARSALALDGARSTRLIILALPMRVLGAASLVIGLGLLVWVAFNIIVARQPQFTGITSIRQLVLPTVLILFGYHWLRRPLTGVP